MIRQSEGDQKSQYWPVDAIEDEWPFMVMTAVELFFMVDFWN